jgi:hypothetical protein
MKKRLLYKKYIIPKIIILIRARRKRQYIYVLGINTSRNIEALQFSMHKKLTTADTVMSANSCHPPEQKYTDKLFQKTEEIKKF